MRKYFGTDGIRGRVNQQNITPEKVLRLGLAVGCYFKRIVGRHLVVIGKDTRLSGYMLEPALVAGLTAAGMDAVTVGPVPTPAIPLLVKSLRADAGIMISASHNPYYDNGIKVFGPDSHKLSDAVEKDIEHLMDEKTENLYADVHKLGRTIRLEDAAGRYTQHVKSVVSKDVNLLGLKIALDTANGAAYKIAPKVFQELGAQIVQIGNTPNGCNINYAVGATFPQTLADFVMENKAHIGFSFDGDADRVIVVDEKGRHINGDQIIAVIATYLKNSDRLKGSVVATTMSNMALVDYLSSINIDLTTAQVGDRYVVAKMKEDGSNFGGEQSGHLILSDFSTTGDGIIASLCILSAMLKSGKTASQLCDVFKPYPQVIKNVPVQDFSVLQQEEVLRAISRAELALKNTGRLIVRKSGTEPLIRIMTEGRDAQLIQKIATTLVNTLEKVIKKC